MRVPWRWPDPAAVAATLTIVWGGGGAAAQLDLDRPAAPAPGEGMALLGLARGLHADIESRAAALHGLAGRERAAAEFSISARILARALLLKAEELGEPGSAHAVAGLTLARRLDEIDATADGLRDGSLPDGAAAAAAVLAAQLREQYDAVPASTADLDRWIRDLLALPVHAGLIPPGERPWEAEPWRAGWGAAGGPDTDLSGAAARWAGVPEPTVEAVRRFDAEVVRPAREWWAYRGTADTVAAAIVAAGRVAEPGGLPDWVPAETADGLVSRLGSAALSAIDPRTREGAMASLADLALAAALMEKLDRLAPASGLPPAARGRALAAARTALLAASAPDAGRGPLAAFDTALRLLADRGQVPGEDTMLRDVRPAWRAMAGAARDAELHLWETLGRIGAGGAGGAMDDPAVVGAIAALRRALDDLAAVRAISAGLDAAGESDAVLRNMAAQRVLRLGQALAAPARREGAAEVLRRFGGDLAAFAVMPGEEALGAAVGGGGVWGEMTGGRAADLWGRLEHVRGLWLDAWARGRDDSGADGPASAAAEDLRRLGRLVAAMHECVVLRDPSVMGAWPGWELSGPAAAALERGAREPVERACRHVLSGDEAGMAAADGALREYEEGWAAVRLVAALERRARERGVVRTPVLVELAAPAPPGGTAWLAPLRADLAAVCRSAEELAHAEAAGDARRREALRAYLNERALAALERLGAAR